MATQGARMDKLQALIECGTRRSEAARDVGGTIRVFDFSHAGCTGDAWCGTLDHPAIRPGPLLDVVQMIESPRGRDASAHRPSEQARTNKLDRDGV